MTDAGESSPERRDAGGPVTPAAAAAATRHWVETLVVGLGLCPFARRVLERDLLRIEVIDTIDVVAVLERLAEEAAGLLAADTEADATTLLVLPDGFVDLDDYLDLVALAEALLEDLGHEGALQIASFHPDYRFAGVPAADAANWSNRSPFPMLQLLREDAVARAVARHPDPEGIPARNIEALRALGVEGVRALLAPRGKGPLH